MVFKEREDLYLVLPRKDLQELCRTHGLPSNGTKGRLAKLLVDRFSGRASSEERPKAPRKRGRPPLPVLATKEPEETAKEGSDSAPQANEQIESFVDKKNKKFAKENAVHSHQFCCRNEDSDCRGIGESCQGGFIIENALQKLPFMQRGNIVNSIEVSSRSGLASSSEFFAGGPASLQFFVSADDGINLYVDLNSSPLNWVRRMNDEVTINKKGHNTSPWSIFHEVRGSGVKSVEMSDQEDTVEPSNKGFNENKESSKSSLTSIVQDGSAGSVMVFCEGNHPSSSCAISSGVEHCNDPCGLHGSALVQEFNRNPSNNSVANDSLTVRGSSLDHSICIHTENVQCSLSDQILNVSNIDHTQSFLSSNSPIKTFEASRVSPNIFSSGLIGNGKDNQMHQGYSSHDKLLQNAEVWDKSTLSNKQDPMFTIHTDTLHSDHMGLIGDLPQEHRCGSFVSAITDNVGLVPSEDQFNKQFVKKKVSSGGDRLEKIVCKTCRRSSTSVLSVCKRQHTSAEVSTGSMKNVRSRNALATATVCSLAACPRRSMRLVLK